MKELALHLLDIAENSVNAGAKNVSISVKEDLFNDRLSVSICDDGKGMAPELLACISDPFMTSRTTRKIGLGIPLLKAAAELCQGYLKISSTSGQGTRLEVEFQHSHIDRMPLGDLPETMLTLVVGWPQIHWRLNYQIKAEKTGEREFIFDDEIIKNELANVSLTEPLILSFIRKFLEEGISHVQEIDSGKRSDLSE